MSDKVYPSALVQPMLKAASAVMHELANFSEGLQQENARLTHELTLAKAAATNKVSLEKVASAASAEKAAAFADFLESRGIIPSGTQEKYASAICKDGNTALDIAMTAIKCAEPPVEQGYGVKSAHVSSRDNELDEESAMWRSCVQIN